MAKVIYRLKIYAFKLSASEKRNLCEYVLFFRSNLPISIDFMSHNKQCPSEWLNADQKDQEYAEINKVFSRLHLRSCEITLGISDQKWFHFYYFQQGFW